MARTLPIPAGQPPEATRKAAGHVVTLAGAEAVAVQAAAPITLAALLWPLIPAARAVAGLASALGPWLPLRPLPEQQAVVVMPRSGGAGRAATVPGGAPGAVRAAGASGCTACSSWRSAAVACTSSGSPRTRTGRGPCSRSAPADGSGRSRRRLPVPGPRPGRAVHRVVQRGPGRRRYRGREDPAAESSRETLTRNASCSPPGPRSPTGC